MTAPRLATASDLVYQPNWEIEPMLSCCAASVPLRLEACYASPKEQQRGLKSLIAAQFDTCALGEYFEYAMTVKEALMAEAFAVPLDMVFGAVIADCVEEYHYDELYIVTDNITRDQHGDVHRGPFSTKGFVQWLVDRDLATVYKGAILYKRKRLRNGDWSHTRKEQAVCTWSWTYRPASTKRFLAKTKDDFRAFYNEVAAQLTFNDSEDSPVSFGWGL